MECAKFTATDIIKEKYGYSIKQLQNAPILHPCISNPEKISECSFTKEITQCKTDEYIGNQYIIKHIDNITNLTKHVEEDGYCCIQEAKSDAPNAVANNALQNQPNQSNDKKYTIHYHSRRTGNITTKDVTLTERNLTTIKDKHIPIDIFIILQYYNTHNPSTAKQFIPAGLDDPFIKESLFAYNMYQISILRQLSKRQEVKELRNVIGTRLTHLFKLNQKLCESNKVVSPDQNLLTLIPDILFESYMNTVAQATIYLSTNVIIDEKNNISITSSEQHQVNIFKLYCKWIDVYNKIKNKNPWTLVEAIYKLVKDLPTGDNIFESNKTYLTSEYTGFSIYNDYTKEQKHKTPAPTPVKTTTIKQKQKVKNEKLEKICKEWLLQHSSTWNIDFEKKGKILAQWLPTSGQMNSLSRTCLDYLADMIDKPHFHIWLTDDQIEECMESFDKSTYVNGRDVPIFVNLDTEQSGCVKLHFFEKKDRKGNTVQLQFTTLNLATFDNTKYQDPVSFIEMIDIAYRMFNKQNNLVIINATVLSSGATGFIRRNIDRNMYSNVEQLFSRLRNVYAKYKDFLNIIDNGFDTSTTIPNEGDIIEWFLKTNPPGYTLNTTKPKLKSQVESYINYDQWKAEIDWNKPDTSSIYTSFEVVEDPKFELTDSVTDYNVRYYASIYNQFKRPTNNKSLNIKYRKTEENILLTFTPEYTSLSKTSGSQLQFVICDNYTTNYSTYNMYFRVWLGENNNKEYVEYMNQVIKELYDIYSPTGQNITKWNDRLRRFIRYNEVDTCAIRFLCLYSLFRHGLLCPTGLIQPDARHERIPYQVASALLLQLCNDVNEQSKFLDRVLITPSTTTKGKIVLLYCKTNNSKRVIKTEFMVEEVIANKQNRNHNQSLHPLTQLLSHIFDITDGMIPITTKDFYDGCRHVKYFLNDYVDEYYNNRNFQCSQYPCLLFPIPNPRNQIHTTIDFAVLYEGHNEKEFTIISFLFQWFERQSPDVRLYLEYNEIAKQLWNSFQSQNTHSYDTFLNLALCTSGRFIDKIRKQYRDTFPHNQIGDDSKLNDLCQDLLSNSGSFAYTNKTRTTKQVGLEYVPPEYLDTKKKFQVDSEEAKNWLLKHYGYEIDDLQDIKTSTFEHMKTKATETLSIIRIPYEDQQTTIAMWFTTNMFKPFHNIALTPSFIEFFMEALQIFNVLESKYNEQESTPSQTTVEPLFSNVIMECRNKWLWFVQKYGRRKFYNHGKASDIPISAISQVVFGYKSSNDNVDKLVRVFAHFDNINNDKKSIIDHWLNMTIGDDKSNLFILIVHWLLLILYEKQLISK